MSLLGIDPEYDLVLATYIHDRIIEASGGVKGFHDEKLIKSALARPFQTAFGKEMYPSLVNKAAAVLDSIARNHGYRDGNKRTAMAVANIFLNLNDIELDFTNKEYEEFMLHVVNNKPTIEEISQWLSRHIVAT